MKFERWPMTDFHSCLGSEDVVLDSIRAEGVILLRAQVLERQHRDRFFVERNRGQCCLRFFRGGRRTAGTKSITSAAVAPNKQRVMMPSRHGPRLLALEEATLCSLSFLNFCG